MPIIDFIEGARTNERVSWQRTLTTLKVILFSAAQLLDTVALVGFHKPGRWSSLGLGRTGWGTAAFLTSALWYLTMGIARKRSPKAASREPEIRLRLLPLRARLVSDTRTKLPGIGTVSLLTLPAALAGFDQFPDREDGRPYVNPGVLTTGLLLVILVLVLQSAGGAWPAALGVLLWLPWTWYAQTAQEWPAIFAGILGVVLQIAVCALVVRELNRPAD